MGSKPSKVSKSQYHSTEPYTTKDGALIRELMHPNVHGNSNQSLAEAIIPAGGSTALHLHQGTEEIYHFTAGHGIMTAGEQSFEVTAGDTICIPPGTVHRLKNTGKTDLKLLCCCAPPYSHDNTELIA